MVKKIEANFCFSIFGKNLKIQNGRHFWEEDDFLKIAKSTFLRYPMGRKFQRTNYFARLRQICVFPFWAKIQKFKMATICREGKIFLKIVKSTFLRYPLGRKFRRNRSISHG